MNPDELTPQEQNIARMADAMIARGKPLAEVQAFVQRAMARETTNRREAAQVNVPQGFAEKALSGVEAFTEGATLGGAGLIGDAVAARLDPDRSFADIRTGRREREQAFRESNPGTAFGLGLAGALLTPGVGAGRLAQGAIKGTGMAARAGRAVLPLAAEGAAQAGIEGAVRGTEDNSLEAVKRAFTTGARNAATGALFAPAVGGVVGGVASMPVEAAQRFLTRGGTSAPVRKLAARLGREGAELVPDAADLLRSPDVSFADVVRGGPRAVRAATNLSPAAESVARTNLGGRGARVGNRLESALTQASGLSPQDVATSAAELTAARASRANPLYDQAINVEGAANRMTPRTPEIEAFLNEPDVRQIVGKLQQTRKFRDLKPDDPEMLDAIYKALSDRQSDLNSGIARAQAANQPDNIGRFASEDVGRAKDQALDAIAGPRGPMPSYRTAVTQFAEDSALQRAYQTGVDIIAGSKSAGEVQEAMRRMTPDEVDLLKRGVVDRMREQIADNTPNDELGEFARQSKGQGQVNVARMGSKERLRAIFGDKGYMELLRAARTEGRFHNTQTEVLGNSSTAKQLRDMGAFGGLADELQQSISPSLAGSVMNFGGRMLRRATQSGMPVFGQGVNTEIADLATRLGPAPAQDLLQKVEQELVRRDAARRTGINAGRKFIGATRALLPNNDR